MSVFHLSVVTPDRLFFDGEAERVIVRTVSGDVGILKGHAKYVSVLGIGALRIKTADGERIAALAEGFIKADKDKTLILASACEWNDEIDVSRAKRAEEAARRQLEAAKDTAEQAAAEARLKRALNRIRIAE